jgi:hypothetical protein
MVDRLIARDLGLGKPDASAAAAKHPETASEPALR